MTKDKFLCGIIKYGLYAILLTPLVFWPRALFAFMTPKFILFQVLVEIIFAFWLILLVYRSGLTQIWADLRRNYIVIALLIFLAVSFISAAFGVDFSRSFWGIGARMTGLFAELHFFAWFLVLVSFFRLKSDFSRSPTSRSPEVGLQILKSDFNSYINFSFVVALLVVLSAFYENTAWRLVYGSTVFNNPTFVGPYFIFHFFWGIYQVMRGLTQTETRTNTEIGQRQSASSRRKSAVRWFFGAGAALLAFVIFLGQVRGVMLGILVGLLVFGLGIIFANVVGRRLKILILALFALIFIGLAGLWLSRESSFVQNTSTLKRLTQISLSQTTVQTRFSAWQAAFQGFKSAGWRTLLGVGPENFNYVFNAHYNPSLLKYGLGETWFDKPHNAFLEILTETGIIGSLAYVLIWFIVAFYLYKIFKRSQANASILLIMEARFFSIILLSVFTAYLSSMFFSFDSFGSWFGLFLFLAFLASQNRDTNIQIHANYTNKRILSILVSLVFISISASVYINYNILRANIVDADALRVFASNPAQGIELFKKSLRYNTPYKAEYQFDLFASIGGAISKNVPLPNLEQNINLVLEEGEKAVAAHPNNAAYYTDLVKLYNILAEKGRDPQIISWAESYGKKSLELSPNRQETLYYLARTALLKGDAKRAVALTKNAVDVEPSINASHWYFGLALIADNQEAAGKTEIKKSLELGYKPQNAAEETFIKNIGL